MMIYSSPSALSGNLLYQLSCWEAQGEIIFSFPLNDRLLSLLQRPRRSLRFHALERPQRISKAQGNMASDVASGGERGGASGSLGEGGRCEEEERGDRQGDPS